MHKVKSKKPAAFLDRDGVINIDYGHVGNKNNITYIKESLQAIKYIKDLGFRVFVITNQAGIAKGYYSTSDYHECMNKITNDLSTHNTEIDDIRYCPYHEDAIDKNFYHKNHPWRKPNPGMILDLIDKWPTNLNASFLVGDSKSDILAAKNAKINGYLFNGNESLLNFVKKIPELNSWKVS